LQIRTATDEGEGRHNPMSGRRKHKVIEGRKNDHPEGMVRGWASTN